MVRKAAKKSINLRGHVVETRVSGPAAISPRQRTERGRMIEKAEVETKSWVSAQEDQIIGEDLVEKFHERLLANGVTDYYTQGKASFDRSVTSWTSKFVARHGLRFAVCRAKYKRTKDGQSLLKSVEDGWKAFYTLRAQLLQNGATKVHVVNFDMSNTRRAAARRVVVGVNHRDDEVGGKGVTTYYERAQCSFGCFISSVNLEVEPLMQLYSVRKKNIQVARQLVPRAFVGPLSGEKIRWHMLRNLVPAWRRYLASLPPADRSSQRLILTLDKASIHTAAFTQGAELAEGICVSFIPAGVTGLVQACDTSGLFRSIKAEWATKAGRPLTADDTALSAIEKYCRRVVQLQYLCLHYQRQYSNPMTFWKDGFATPCGGGHLKLRTRLRSFIQNCGGHPAQSLGAHITPAMRAEWEAAELATAQRILADEYDPELMDVDEEDNLIGAMVRDKKKAAAAVKASQAATAQPTAQAASSSSSSMAGASSSSTSLLPGGSSDAFSQLPHALFEDENGFDDDAVLEEVGFTCSPEED